MPIRPRLFLHVPVHLPHPGIHHRLPSPPCLLAHPRRPVVAAETAEAAAAVAVAERDRLQPPRGLLAHPQRLERAADSAEAEEVAVAERDRVGTCVRCLV